MQLSARVARQATSRWRARRSQPGELVVALSGRRQPRPRGLRRSAPLRHRTRQRGQAPVVLRRQALLPRRRTGPRRGRGGAADVLRPLSRGAAGRRGQPPRHPGAARLVVAARQIGRRAQRYVRDVDFRAALIDETAAFGELIRGADPATPVPTCPGWTLRQLFRHVGRGNRWAAQIVADRRDEPLDPREVRDGKPPDDPDGAIDWLHGGRAALIDAVDERRRATPRCGRSSARGPRSGGSGDACTRRRCTAPTPRSPLGARLPAAAELAADGITEWLERVVIQAERRARAAGRRADLHLHATDDGLGPRGSGRSSADDDGIALVARAQQGRRGGARQRERSAAGDRAPPVRGRRRHRGFRRRRRVGRLAGPHPVLSGVRFDHDDFGDRDRSGVARRAQRAGPRHAGGAVQRRHRDRRRARRRRKVTRRCANGRHRWQSAPPSPAGMYVHDGVVVVERSRTARRRRRSASCTTTSRRCSGTTTWRRRWPPPTDRRGPR